MVNLPKLTKHITTYVIKYNFIMLCIMLLLLATVTT